MAWTKIPKENHPIFEAALPADKRVETIKMFGGVAAMVNGNMAAGLWADSMMVRLSRDQYAYAIKMKGATEFDPMGRGKPMADMIVLPSSMMKSVPSLKEWIQHAIEFTATLPPKKKGEKAPAAKKIATKKAATKKAATEKPKKKVATKKPATKKKKRAK